MKLLSTPARGFFSGFICALTLFGIGVVVWNFHIEGGQHADSPDGRYSIRIMTSLNPVAGDPYIVALEDRSSGAEVRRLQIDLSGDERAKPLRGKPRVIQWNANSDYADIQIEQKPLVRVFAP